MFLKKTDSPQRRGGAEKTKHIRAFSASQRLCGKNHIFLMSLVPQKTDSPRRLWVTEKTKQIKVFPASQRLRGKNHIFLTSLISRSSIIGAGPEMPPSLRTRQKCTAINAEARMGIATQCQM